VCFLLPLKNYCGHVSSDIQSYEPWAPLGQIFPLKNPKLLVFSVRVFTSIFSAQGTCLWLSVNFKSLL
jgi:hypothetical protein